MRRIVIIVAAYFAATLVIFLMSLAAYGEPITLGLMNTVYISGDIDQSTVRRAQTKFLSILERKKDKLAPIYLVVDSQGGSVGHSTDLVRFFNSFSNLRLITITLRAASSAALLVQALQYPRYILADSMLMFHRAYLSFDGQFETGELESRLEHAKRFVRYFENIIADRIGITLEEYKQKILYEWHLFGQDIVDNNAADKIVEIRCTPNLIAASHIEHGLLTAKEVFECPLLR